MPITIEDVGPYPCPFWTKPRFGSVILALTRFGLFGITTVQPQVRFR